MTELEEDIIKEQKELQLNQDDYWLDKYGEVVYYGN